MNMTLEQVRDWHRFQWSLNEARGTPWDGKEHEAMADAIEAHLSRQSDGVSDEVVEIMRAVLTAFRHNRPAQEKAEPVAPWLPVDQLPISDDLFWFRRGDIVDGPRLMQRGGYDVDEWDYFSPCVAPPTKPVAAVENHVHVPCRNCNSMRVAVAVPHDDVQVPLPRDYTAPPAERVRVPDGWKLVPIEPTPKMVDATWHDPIETDEHAVESHNTRNRRIYAAMLSAAPEASHET